MSQQVFIEQVQGILQPRFAVLLEVLAEHPDTRIFAFFAGLTSSLQAAEEEADIIMLFAEMSRAAFLGFEYDAHTWALTDELLAASEQIAQTMTASSRQ